MAMPPQYATASIKISMALNPNIANVLWYQPQFPIALPDAIAEANELCDALDTLVAGKVKAFLPADANYVGVGCRLSIDGVTFTGSDNSGAGAGTATGDSTAAFTAAIIRKQTNLAGKEGRGRWFVGPVAEVNTDGSLLVGAGISALQEIAEALSTPVSVPSGMWVPQMYSRKLDQLNDITSVQILTILATQRRRRLRLPTL